MDSRSGILNRMTEAPEKRNLIVRGFIWLGSRPAAMWARMQPEPRTLRGISFATYLAAVALGAYWGYRRNFSADVLVLADYQGPPLVGAEQMWWDLGAGALLAALVALLAWLLFALTLRLGRWLPTAMGRIGLGAVIVVAIVSDQIGFPPLQGLALGVLVLVLIGGMVGALASLTSGKFGEKRWYGKATVWAFGLLGIAGVAALIYGAAHKGTTTHLTSIPAYAAESEPAMLTLPNLAEPGPFGKIKTLTYGSGTDIHRPEFGAEVVLKTEAVNGKPFAALPKGHKGKKRELFWQFPLSEMPINGRVWYPEGDGPFPLVLIVHGNHSMSEFSDEGYAYLGTHLASHGYILCSVDQNFINGNMRKENDARGWLLLEHLKVWQGFHEAAGNPFAGKVDMQNIALMGHSRGGEAVTHAALFNRLKHYPDDASVTFDFGFAIKSIVSIAPVDGQYKPAGRLAPVRDVNYLTLHGSHDADVSQFYGDRIYNRLKFAPGSDCFKASVYVYRANHGQFNTVWGATDRGPPRGLLLNRAALLSGDEQRQVAKVYITAFLAATMQAQRGYLPLFANGRTGRDWLPEAVLTTRYEDASFRVLADFEEDVDVTTTTAPGGAIRADGLAVYREGEIPFRGGRGGSSSARGNHGAFLGWATAEAEPAEPEPAEKEAAEKEAAEKEAGEAAPEVVAAEQLAAPVYEVSLPAGFLTAAADQQVVFHLAEVDEKPKAKDYSPKSDDDDDENGNDNNDEADDEDDEQDEAEDEQPRPALQLAVELVTADGAVGLPLSRYGRILPPLKAVTSRAPFLGGSANETEITLQYFALPLADFVAADAKLDLATVTAIRLVFDRVQPGVVVIDRIGVASVPK